MMVFLTDISYVLFHDVTTNELRDKQIYEVKKLEMYVHFTLYGTYFTYSKFATKR